MARLQDYEETQRERLTVNNSQIQRIDNKITHQLYKNSDLVFIADLTGTILKVFKSVHYALDSLTGISPGDFFKESDCIRIKKTLGGSTHSKQQTISLINFSLDYAKAVEKRNYIIIPHLRTTVTIYSSRISVCGIKQCAKKSQK